MYTVLPSMKMILQSYGICWYSFCSGKWLTSWLKHFLRTCAGFWKSIYVLPVTDVPQFSAIWMKKYHTGDSRILQYFRFLIFSTWSLSSNCFKHFFLSQRKRSTASNLRISQLKNKRSSSCHLLFCFTSYVLNMFRTLIYPSSLACDYSVELPHWSYCSWFDMCWRFGVVGFE